METLNGNDPLETFPDLGAIPGIRHAFLRRIPGIDVCVDREEALQRLAGEHESLRAKAGLGDMPLVTTEQVHGDGVLILQSGDPVPKQPAQGIDAILTTQKNLCLGIYVADCAAVYLVDRQGPGIGLVHSGKKGTAAGIVGKAIDAMKSHFGTKTQNLFAFISPCIRPPHYEIDIATQIAGQAREREVEVADCGICTAANESLYYSYRREKGRTGRMLALLARTL